MQIRVDAGLELRSVATSDAEPLFARVDTQRAHLVPWLPWVEGTRTSADTRRFIERSIEQETSGSGLAALIVGEGQILGVIGFNTIDAENRSAEMGYWLGKDAEGRGIMTRSAQALLRYGFDTLGLHRVCIRAAVENARSRAIPERLGFVEEGILRDAERHGDRFLDLVCYSRLRHEAEPARAGAAPEERSSP